MDEKYQLKFIENIPATQLLERIKYGNEPVEYVHTNLQSAKRSKIDIAEIMACTATYSHSAPPKYSPIQSLITYPIERMIYFDVIATIETELQIGEELDLYTYIEHIHNTISKMDFKNMEDEMTRVAQERTESIISAIKSKQDIDPSFQKYVATYEKIQTAFSGEHYTVSQKFLGAHQISADDAPDLLAKMAIEDMVYNDLMKEGFKNVITPQIKDIISTLIENKVLFPIHDIRGQVVGHAPLRRLSLHQDNERTTFLMSGAPASGKGTILAKIFHDAKEIYNISEQDMVKVNTDTHRLLVCKGRMENLGPKKELHVSLNNDEAYLICSMAYDKMREKIDANLAPHMLIDAVALNDERIEIGTNNRGRLEISVVSIELEESLLRAQKRGESSGRYVQTEYLINSHRNVTNTVYGLLCNPLLVGKKSISVSIYDNNVSLGSPSILVAKIDMAAKKAEILDPERLANFRGKRHIESLSQVNPDQFFSKPLTLTRRASFSSSDLFSRSGYNVEEKAPEVTIQPPF